MSRNEPNLCPTALAAGLLTASAVTLLGVVRDLNPEVILVRAVVAGVACAAVALVVRVLLQILAPEVASTSEIPNAAKPQPLEH